MTAGYQEWLPQLEARRAACVLINGVEVSPEVAGIVSAINFKQGEDVQRAWSCLNWYTTMMLRGCIRFRLLLRWPGPLTRVTSSNSNSRPSVSKCWT